MSSSVRRAIAAARVHYLTAARVHYLTATRAHGLIAADTRRLVVLGAIAVCALLPGARAAAQTPDDPYADRFSLVGGVSQLLLGGGNVEGTWYTSRFILAYSHGVNLQLGGGLLPTAVQDQQLQATMPWTTGVGLGYRVTSTFDVRLEVKQHRFALRYDDQAFRGPTIAEYTTTTVGVGAYYRYYPFARRTGAARGLVIVPSVRYWPNVTSSLDDNILGYANARTGRSERHQALTQGVPGTGGLLANVSVGYTFRVGPAR